MTHPLLAGASHPSRAPPFMQADVHDSMLMLAYAYRQGPRIPGCGSAGRTYADCATRLPPLLEVGVRHWQVRLPGADHQQHRNTGEQRTCTSLPCATQAVQHSPDSRGLTRSCSPRARAARGRCLRLLASRCAAFRTCFGTLAVASPASSAPSGVDGRVLGIRSALRIFRGEEWVGAVGDKHSCIWEDTSESGTLYIPAGLRSSAARLVQCSPLARAKMCTPNRGCRTLGRASNYIGGAALGPRGPVLLICWHRRSRARTQRALNASLLEMVENTHRRTRAGENSVQKPSISISSQSRARCHAAAKNTRALSPPQGVLGAFDTRTECSITLASSSLCALRRAHARPGARPSPPHPPCTISPREPGGAIGRESLNPAAARHPGTPAHRNLEPRSDAGSARGRAGTHA